MDGTPMRQWDEAHGQQPDWGWLERKYREGEWPRAPPGGSVALSVMSGLNSAAHCTPAGYSHTGQLWKFPGKYSTVEHRSSC